ncbi:MAG: GT-D fold domain-containing glycosyltransferase [Fusobacterium mortiferum]|nr:GT-D fold domain-containing glycosyltransferase [Fusobacterium mortiferum]
MIKKIRQFLYIKRNEVLLNKLKEERWNIKTTKETIEKIIQGYSISRYGDGEFDIAFRKKELYFQEYDSELSKYLREILNSNLEKLLVAIPRTLIEIKNLKENEKYFWSRYYLKQKEKLEKNISKEKVYYDSMISRFYMPYINPKENIESIDKLIKYFSNKKILILEGENTRFGLGNSLLKNSSEIQRIILPDRNGFRKYKEVIKFVLENFTRDNIILIALGPTATVLAYEFSKEGYQALDIGHLDVEYEWYLLKAKTKVDLQYKTVSEVSEIKEKEILDKKLEDLYLKQIKKKII